MPLINCDFTDPIGTPIVTGTVTFTADYTDPTVLKSTSAETTPGVNITLLACTYKVYYKPVDVVMKYIGEIIILDTTLDNTTLVSLLEANQ